MSKELELRQDVVVENFDDEAGMTTTEYALGTVAVIALVAVIIAIMGDRGIMESPITSIINGVVDFIGSKIPGFKK